MAKFTESRLLCIEPENISDSSLLLHHRLRLLLLLLRVCRQLRKFNQTQDTFDSCRDDVHISTEHSFCPPAAASTGSYATLRRYECRLHSLPCSQSASTYKVPPPWPTTFTSSSACCCCSSCCPLLYGVGSYCHYEELIFSTIQVGN